MQLNGHLLDQYLDDLEIYDPKTPSIGTYTVFEHVYQLGTVTLPENHIISDQQPRWLPNCTFQATKKSFRIVPPSRRSKTPAKKRRKNIPFAKPALVTIDSLSDARVQDILHTAELGRAAATVPIAETRGPNVIITVDGNEASISVALGIYLLKNAGPFPRIGFTNRAICRLLAQITNDPTFIDPEPYAASAADLFEIMTRKLQLQAPRISPEGLLTPLLPFQTESLRWALRREGKDFENGQLVDLDPQIRDYVLNPPLGWRHLPDIGIYINPYTLETRTEPPEPRQDLLNLEGQFCGGGLLAEEMGLGKTLEMIALILLNKRPPSPPNAMVTDMLTGHPARPSRATLVIVPRAIIDQWATELEKHAPSLRVFKYLGRAVEPVDPATLADNDVVLVTYSVLAAEVYSAMFNPGQRNTRFWRERRDLETARSPLVQVQFWRVLLDEVQMIHTGVSNAAKVARLVPRVHAWGVTGTPVKTSMSDLLGIFVFLGTRPFTNMGAWQRLLASPADFEQTISTLAIRHTKPMVSEQLKLPTQRRRLISLPFSDIERHNYDQVNARYANSEDVNMSQWLVSLRQACFNAGLGTSKTDNPGQILTVDQVLARVVDDAEANLASKTRARLVAELELGQYLDKADRLPEAIKIWQEVAEELKSLSAELKSQIDGLVADSDSRAAEAQTLKAQYDAEMKAQELAQEQVSAEPGAQPVAEQVTPVAEPGTEQRNEPVAPSTGPRNEAVVKQEDTDVPPVSTEIDSDLTKLRALENRSNDAEQISAAAKNRVKSVRLRYRMLQELQHRVYFFLGTGYYRLTERAPELDEDAKKHNSEKESMYYEMADGFRAELLKEATEVVEATQARARKQEIKKVDIGIYSDQIKYLNEQADFLQEIYDELFTHLTTSLLETNTVAEEPAEIEAYTATLDIQEKAYVLLDVLEIILRDRNFAVKGGHPPKVDTKDQGQWTDFRKQLMEKRRQLQRTARGMTPLALSLRMHQNWAGSDEQGPQDEDFEKAQTARMVAVDKAFEAQKRELRKWGYHESFLRELFNQRLEYYKQLQSLSDRVVDPELPEGADVSRLVKTRENLLEKAQATEAETSSRLRYVHRLEVQDPKLRDSLSSQMQAKAEHDDKGTGLDPLAGACIICHDQITRGVFTVCGHKYCSDCITHWLELRRTCPLCHNSLGPQDIIPFRTGDREDTVRVRDLSNELYKQISVAMFNEIVRYPNERLYGAKIDMVTRHALYLRDKDPQAQIVIFSQWAPMLWALGVALNANGLRTATINDHGAAAFRGNPDIACFLLHAKSDSAGLTLVNATHVFLCEPLLNTAIELQAISRVHRIGQLHPTTVWLFSVENTVEQAILALTTERRVQQISELRNQEEDKLAHLDDAETAILANTVGDMLDRQSGSELVLGADLRRVLHHKFDA